MWQLQIHQAIIWSSDINNIFKWLSNVFNLADYILIVGFGNNDRNHNSILKKVMQIYYKENLN